MTREEWDKFINNICSGTDCSGHKCPFRNEYGCTTDSGDYLDEEAFQEMVNDKLAFVKSHITYKFLERKLAIDTREGTNYCEAISPYIGGPTLL